MRVETQESSKRMMEPHLVVFDQAVAARSPAGSCVLAECAGLADTRKVTVISEKCEIADNPNIAWVRVPLPRGPILLRYLAFQWLAPRAYRRSGAAAITPKIVQTTQGQFPGADLAYAHFCHRAYLRGPWKASTARGLRRLLRWCNHSFNAYWERAAFRRARVVVVPSQGLARELGSVYPEIADKVRVIANPVDLPRFRRAADFDRAAFRAQQGFAQGERVLAFVALGDFARKGLGLVIDALGSLAPAERDRLRVLVIGGQAGEIELFRGQAERAGVADRVRFVGLQQDVRPYLWSGDVFAFPSAYEIFSLAILQGAAAGLPVIVSRGLYGAEEFMVDGQNGWLVERTAADVARVLSGIAAGRYDLAAMGAAAEASVQAYSRESFVERWRRLYAELPPR